jgi:hypothetical protein
MTASNMAIPILAALSGLSNAQGFEWKIFTQLPKSTTSPALASAFTVSYNPMDAASSIAAEITGGSSLGKRTVSKSAVSPCVPQPLGKAPIPAPDTPSAFAALPYFASVASAAPTPSGWTKTFTNLNASNNALGYLGFQNQDNYDPNLCAASCDKIKGCMAVNLCKHT